MTKIDKSIFKAYDIRGIYPDQLDEEGAYQIARGYATLIQDENPGKKLKIVVGYDMRLSSPSLKQRVVEGLIDSGIDVVDVGLVSTPTFYFAVAKYGYDGGMQVSASHNPKNYSGLKMTRAGAVPVSGDTGIMQIHDLVESQKFIELAEKKGSVENRTSVLADLTEDHFKHFDASKIKPFKIVVDASNAMGALDIEAFFAKLPCEVIKMNFKLDGNFPAHEANPMLQENTEDLRKRIVAEGVDLGIAPDGDADRYFFYDEKGNEVRQSILRGLMAAIELDEHPGATVAYDIRPGRITQDMILEHGGKPVVTRVGHSLIKEKMIETGAIFGGESSGHYFYKLDYGVFECPLILTGKLLEYLSSQDKTFSEVMKPYYKYAHSGELNTKMSDRVQVEQKLSEVKEKFKDGKLVLIDGITIEYPDVWFNLRASNTEPVIRLTVEAKDEQTMEKWRDELLEMIRG